MAVDMYVNHQVSLYKYLNTFAAQMVTATYLKSDYELFNFDAFADLDNIPDKDILGVSQFNIDSDSGLFIVSAMLGISTYDDINLARLDRMIGRLFEKLESGQLVPFVEESSGNQIGVMRVLNGTSVLPVVKTRTRPLKFVAVALSSDQRLP